MRRDSIHAFILGSPVYMVANNYLLLNLPKTRSYYRSPVLLQTNSSVLGSVLSHSHSQRKGPYSFCSIPSVFIYFVLQQGLRPLLCVLDRNILSYFIFGLFGLGGGRWGSGFKTTAYNNIQCFLLLKLLLGY
jgi:hypothetical protein